MDERLTKNTFKKCDMHIHSSSCYSRDYDESSFFATVLSSGLDVVAITDHNNVDVRLLFDLDKQMSKNNKTLIGGVELNVRLKEETVKAYGLELGSEKKGDYFHAVVWFSIDSADEVGDIVRRLFTESILRSFENEEMSEEELDSLSLEDFAKLTDGVAVFLEDFQSQIARIPHFFIPHENKARSLSDYLPNGSQRNQEYKAKLFYYSHAMAVEGGEKSRKRISETLADNLNITVASLFFSDAKTLDEIGQRFTWIDFDKTLDSLLLAISDPESRIRTSDQNSELPQLNTAHFLESVSFNMRKIV